MILNSELIRGWFGFTRRERSSSFILLVIIVVIIALRYAIPEKKLTIEDNSFMVSESDNPSGSDNMDISPDIQLFSFDPNTASYDTLIMLGFSEKESSTLINYRNKGGKFREPEDIKKIYGIEEIKAKELIPFVKVNADTIKPSGHNLSRQNRSIIDLNRCDSAILVTLPGIGPVLSGRIIKYRNLLGGFARIDQLREVYGLPEETFDLIEGRLSVDTAVLKLININLADYNELRRIPYFERYEVAAIIKYRELIGNVGSVTDLIENKILTKEKADKVRSYLIF